MDYHTEKKKCPVKSLTFYENLPTIAFIWNNDYFYSSAQSIFLRDRPSFVPGAITLLQWLGFSFLPPYIRVRGRITFGGEPGAKSSKMEITSWSTVDDLSQADTTFGSLTWLFRPPPFPRVNFPSEYGTCDEGNGQRGIYHKIAVYVGHLQLALGFARWRFRFVVLCHLTSSSRFFVSFLASERL